MLAKTIILLPLIILFLLPLSQVNSQETTLQVDKILVLTIDHSINPATYNYLKAGLKRAKEENFDLIDIEINTPGGLVSTTKDILTLFGNSDIPVAVWVKPEGASATSAGAIIASGAHLIFMADGTNMGAATPVQNGADIESQDLRKKAINDLVALTQSLAESKGRNQELFGEMIKKASSFTARDAKVKNLIDEIVNNRNEFKNKLNGKSIKIKGKKLTLLSNEILWVEQDWDVGQKLLNIFANPSMAYVLFLIGAALIYLELQAAGGFIAGSIGAICLLLAGIGFQVLPLNFGALGLIILSFVLFVIEIYVTSYGLLAISGIASLIFGSMFLYRTDDSYLSLSTSIIFSTVAGIASFMIFIAWFMFKDKKNIGVVKFNQLVGKSAKIIKVYSKEAGIYRYSVKVGAEFWKAQSKHELKINEYYKVLEHDQNRMLLTI